MVSKNVTLAIFWSPKCSVFGSFYWRLQKPWEFEKEKETSLKKKKKKLLSTTSRRIVRRASMASYFRALSQKIRTT